MDDNFEESDVMAATNAPVGEIFSEIRDHAAQYKTSSILLGTLLRKVKEDKLAKGTDFKNFKNYLVHLGINSQTANELMRISEILETKFPEHFESLKEGSDVFLPGNRAMNVADGLSTISNEASKDFTSQTGMKKLKEYRDDRLGDPEDVPLKKLAKSGQRFTSKVLNSSYVPEPVKDGINKANAELQNAAAKESSE